MYVDICLTGAEFPLNYLSLFENSLDTPAPSVTVTDVEIEPVPTSTLTNPGPLVAAKFNGASSLSLGTDNQYYKLIASGTLSVLFQTTTKGVPATLLAYGGTGKVYSSCDIK